MKNKNKGFTLVEMMVVIAIMGILTSIIGIGIPAYQRFQDKNQLDIQTRNIYYALLKARNDAIMDGGKRSVWILQDTGKILIVNVQDDQSNKKIELSNDIKITANTYVIYGNKLELHPIGTVSNAGHITFKSPRGKHMTIVVQMASGKISMKEGKY